MGGPSPYSTKHGLPHKNQACLLVGFNREDECNVNTEEKAMMAHHVHPFVQTALKEPNIADAASHLSSKASTHHRARHVIHTEMSASAGDCTTSGTCAPAPCHQARPP